MHIGLYTDAKEGIQISGGGTKHTLGLRTNPEIRAPVLHGRKACRIFDHYSTRLNPEAR